MGKYADSFELKLADLTADVESKIGALIIRNPKLTKVVFSKPYCGLITFTAKISTNDKGSNYVELETDSAKSNMREALTIQQMIDFLEEIEDFLAEE